MKFNVNDLHPETVSACLMAMIYDETNFDTNVYRVFGLRCRVWAGPGQKYFYAVVLDPDNDRIWIAIRGTDGKNLWWRLASWGINFNAGITKDGYHKGFSDVALKISKNVAGYIKDSKYVYIASHSQGSGTLVRLVALICRVIKKKMLPDLKHLQADPWCSPPGVNAIGKAEIDGYLKDGIVSINNWYMPGDLISKKKGILRGLMHGRDVGNMIKLPDMILPKYGIADSVSHSPTLCLYAFAAHLVKWENRLPENDLKCISFVLNEGMVVN